MKTIAIIGETGYIASYFKQRLKHKYTVLGLSQKYDNYYDLTQLTETLKTHKVDFVINAAGYTGKPNVDACESNKGEAIKGNVVLLDTIAKACKSLDIKWGHISSGCIYNGYTEGGFSETDEPNFSFRKPPCSWYSGTKALGEEVLSDYDNVYVWRLRIPFNNENTSRNYITKILNYDRLLSMPNSFSWIDEFVDACIATVEKNAPTGIYNVTNPGVINAEEVIDLCKKYGIIDPTVNKEYFSGVETFTSSVKAPRSNTTLNSDKITEFYKMTDVKEAFEICLKKLEKLNYG